jgi:hypothetical protein
MRLLMLSGHRFTHSSGVYTNKGSVLPWEEGGKGGKSAIAKRAIAKRTIAGDACIANKICHIHLLTQVLSHAPQLHLLPFHFLRSLALSKQLSNPQGVLVLHTSTISHYHLFHSLIYFYFTVLLNLMLLYWLMKVAHHVGIDNTKLHVI